MKKEQLEEYCRIEFENLDLVLKEIKELLPGAAANKTELVALGAYIHNFYNGIENILKRIFQFQNIVLKDSAIYHKELLKRAAQEGIINESLAQDLSKFLAFRHFFIHSYGFLIEWDKLKVIADNIAGTGKNFKSAIKQYLNNLT